MLSMSKVLYFIKTQLGYPNVIIEKSDNEMELFIKMFTLMEFSKYVPDVNEVLINVTDPRNQVAGQPNMYYLKDPDGCDILTIKDIISGEQQAYIQGYPFFSYLTPYESIPQKLIEVDQSETMMQFSRADNNFDFFPPNRLRIYPRDMFTDKWLVRYERVQPEDLTKIPAEFQIEFLYLAMSDVMRMCGNIRNKYTTINTPFENIPVNAELGPKGDELRTSIIDKLSKLPPNTIIYVG